MGASTITSDFDNADIYRDIKEVTDTYGNKFMSIPKFYIKKTVNGDAWTWQISLFKQDSSYYLPACFYDFDNNKELPYVLVGKYLSNLNVDKLESKSGVLPQGSKSITDFRAYARNNNNGSIKGYQIFDIHVLDLLQVLFYVEFATLDSQAIMKGYTAPTNTTFALSGTTDSVSTPSGSQVSNTTGTNAMKYRGIENLYGNINIGLDGINVNSLKTYIALDANKYAIGTYSGDYKAVGYDNAYSDGIISKMGFDSNYPFVNMPIETGTSLYADSYTYNGGERQVTYGGHYNSAASAGINSFIVFHLQTYPAPSIGSRLVKKLYKY